MPDADLTLQTGNPAHGGSVVARDDGRVVLVHYALPGETVEARPRGKRGGVAWATAERILESSPERVAAPCPHFGQCGGCQWQHARYETQLEIKRKVVEDQWSRAGLRFPPAAPVLGMADPWRYRIRGEFEAIYPAAGGFELGFHRLRSHSVLPIRTCPLHDLRIERALGAFRQAVPELGIRGLKHVELTVEPAGLGLLWRAALEGRPAAAPGELTARVAELLPDLVVLDDSLDYEFWGLRFRVRSDTFVQANYRQMQVLYQTALDQLAPTPGDAVLDLYAGIGTISLALARRAGSVTAIEENPQAVALGRLAVRINGVTNVEFRTGRVEKALREVRLGAHQVALLDPPRAGLEQAAVAELLRLGPQRIVYVSCEPSTQARDIAALVRGGYRVRRAAIVDMFPQTYHIESVVLLERTGA
ncbi:MAG: class I SAM-dependent RNA methyltransferase [Chloroflexi bacterium]|nr:MAG: class I SAM-dependent RNA methyltransferase [Chloroflexota bacterium]TME15491.1 MAG: class I SAM-dependent RNA methyltransferase [Chloroflexota bacterium]